VTARDADVLVQRGIAVDRRLLRRHDAVGARVDARDRHGEVLRPAQVLRAQVRDVRRGAQRMHDQPIERLDERRRLAAARVERDRAAERDDRAHALGRLVRGVHREQAAEAPPDEAHLVAAAVMHVAQLLLERGRVPAREADVAAEAPGLHLVAAVLEEELEHDERALVRHEAGKQQDRVPVAARRAGEQRQRAGQRRGLEERARLDQLVQQSRLADVGFADGHRGRARSGVFESGAAGVADCASGCSMPQALHGHGVPRAGGVDRRQCEPRSERGLYCAMIRCDRRMPMLQSSET